jgi:tRNA threonylcarbamoyladenosine biosynthesis protein TsaE
MTWQINSTSSEQTEALGEKLGSLLKGGEVVELVSDLGGGKTTFTRGLARGLGSLDSVASPTFTISKLYQAGDIEVHHFDFYRLAEPGIVADELAEVIGDPHAIAIVEWADSVQHVLPNDRITLTIKQMPDGSRQLTFTTSEAMGYLLEALKS